MEIILLLGVIGSGKTHTANRIISENPQNEYEIINFADALKDIASDILDADMFEEENKCTGWFRTEEDYFTGRQFLQRLGASVREHIGERTWIKVWGEKVKKAINSRKSVICADCRYVNEVDGAKAIFASGFIDTTLKTIFCDYESFRYDATNTHESEKLAQYIKGCGLKDGQEVPDCIFAAYGWD